MSDIETIEELMQKQQVGWWEAISETIPELQALADTPQPPEHHAEGDVAAHTRLAIAACPSGGDPDLRWVALLHDIGKPATTEQQADGRLTAHGHASLGAQMAEAILERLEMPEERRQRIVWAIRHHIFHHAWQLQPCEEPSRRQCRFIADPEFPFLLEFLKIDSIATQGPRSNLQTHGYYLNLRQRITQEGS